MELTNPTMWKCKLRNNYLSYAVYSLVISYIKSSNVAVVYDSELIFLILTQGFKGIFSFSAFNYLE